MAEKSDYIKREDAIKQFEYEDTTYESAEIVGILSDIPSADVVEVVRCKDCKWYEKEWCYCGLHNNADKDIKPTDYCIYGERKDNE